jgi:hypothetical protein
MSEAVAFRTVVNERRREEARDLRRSLFRDCRLVCDELGETASGYALVVWTRDGDLRSVYNVGPGPIGAALVPTLVSDALNRHIAADQMPSSDERNGAG